MDIEKAIDMAFEADRLRQKILDHDQILFCMIDAFGHFTNLNRSWTRALGYTEKEMKSFVFADLIHPDDVGQSMDAYEFYTNTGKSAFKMFWNRYRAKSGEWVSIQWIQPIYDESSNSFLFLSFELPKGVKGITEFANGFIPKKYITLEKSHKDDEYIDPSKLTLKELVKQMYRDLETFRHDFDEFKKENNLERRMGSVWKKSNDLEQDISRIEGRMTAIEEKLNDRKDSMRNAFGVISFILSVIVMLITIFSRLTS